MQKMNENLKKLMLEKIVAAHAIYSNYEPLFKETVKKFVKDVKKEIDSQGHVSSSPGHWELRICDDTGELKISNTQWIYHLYIKWTDVYKKSYYAVSTDQEDICLDGIEKHLRRSSKNAEYRFWEYIEDVHLGENPIEIKNCSKMENARN